MSKVLIVDDSFLARTLMKKILEKLNHEVVGEAETGEKALMLYRTVLPDIIMMDVVMPGIGGIEAATRILHAYPAAKIIITSSHVQNNLKAELVKRGLGFLVVKPINESKLADAIQQIKAGIKSNISLDDAQEKKLRTEVRNYLKSIANDCEEGECAENNPEIGKKVSVSHCFSDQAIDATIVSSMEGVIKLKLDKKIDSFVFNIEDPLTICLMNGDSIEIAEASIIDINTKEKCISVTKGNTFSLFDDSIDDCFPCSISIDLKTAYSNKKLSAIIKNVGPYNMRIVTKADLDIGSTINFDIFLNDKIITLNAEVSGKSLGSDRIEYEIKTTYIDLNSKKQLKLYVLKLKENHERAVHRLLGEKK